MVPNMIRTLLNDLFPICRSITGNGLRESLNRISKEIDIDLVEVPTGKKCFDWTIPKEWNIKDAYIKDKNGNKIISFTNSNLHVLNYSIPINKILPFSELKNHLHTLPNQPEAIPYRTSYYNETWGFCLKHNDLSKFNENAEYHVVIKSTLDTGSLTYGEAILNPQSTSNSYMISTYLCHPSMVNDNLSGPLALVALMKRLKEKKLKHKYLFLIAPETIGSLAWLNNNFEEAKNLNGGMILTTCAKESETPSFKSSFKENDLLDRACRHVLSQKPKYIEYKFFADGSDERQFSSPGFRVPCISIHKGKYYEYDEYHTSLDSKDHFSEESLIDTVDSYEKVINILEKNDFFISKIQHGEVQLGKRGLYPTLAGSVGIENDSMIDSILKARTETLFWSDGNFDLLEIAERTELPFDLLYDSILPLIEQKILVPK